jgi:MFS family permease
VLGARDLGATGADVARLTTVFLLSQVTVSLSGGWLGDWFGVRILPVLGSLATVAAIALAFSATDLTLIYAAVALAGLVSMLIVADITIVLEVAPAAKRPEYMAGLNLILGPLALPAPLLLGRLVDVAGFHTMFGAAIVVALAGLLAVLAFAFGPGRKIASRSAASSGPG